MLSLLDCHPDSSVYDEVKAIIKRVEKVFSSSVSGRAVAGVEPAELMPERFSFLPENACGFLYLTVTAGECVSKMCSKWMSDGEYMDALVLNAMSDAYLFSMEKAVVESLKEELCKLGLGVCCRLEAGSDYPLSFHRYIYEQCHLEQYLDMKMTDGYMFEPEKTLCIVLGLTKDTSRWEAQHDCRKCSVKNCAYKNNITD